LFYIGLRSRAIWKSTSMLNCNWLCPPTRLFSVQKLWWWMVQFQDRSRSWWSIQPTAHQYQQVFFYYVHIYIL